MNKSVSEKVLIDVFYSWGWKEIIEIIENQFMVIFEQPSKYRKFAFVGWMFGPWGW